MAIFELLVLCWSLTLAQQVLAFPEQTSGVDATSESAPKPTDCENKCSGSGQGVGAYYWYPISVNTTIVAATVVKIYNNRTGKYRNTTIYNTDLGGYTIPTNTNEDGTQVHTVTQSLSKYNKNTTYTVAYPTRWVQYDDHFEWNGTVASTDSDGQPTCLSVASNTREYFDPYTPVVATPTPGAAGTEDPKGWTYTIDGSSFNFPGPLDQSGSKLSDSEANYNAYPDVAALHECDFGRQLGVAPAEVMYTAKFETVTSTSHELGLGGAEKTPPPPPPPEPKKEDKPAKAADKPSATPPPPPPEPTPRPEPTPSSNEPEKQPLETPQEPETPESPEKPKTPETSTSTQVVTQSPLGSYIAQGLGEPPATTSASATGEKSASGSPVFSSDAASYRQSVLQSVWLWSMGLVGGWAGMCVVLAFV